MGNHRFRLSDMIPNAWFYKLKDMGSRRPKTHKKKPITTSPPPTAKLHHPRQSYHFPRDDSPPPPFHYNLDPPRKSTKLSRNTTTSNKKTAPKKSKSSPRLVTTTHCSSCRPSIESLISTKPDSTTEEYPNSTATSSENESLFPELGSDPDHNNLLPCSTPTRPTTSCSSCYVDANSLPSYEKFENFDHLPPILTKRKEIRRSSTSVKEDIIGISHKEEMRTTTSLVKRNPSPSSAAAGNGMKVKITSPRIGISKKVQINHNHQRKSVSRRSDSFAVVKRSKNPQQDFKESMVEMIVENNIKGSKDLEELLACYLSLNSDEYHDLIINVFKQIWFTTLVNTRI